MSQRFSEEWYGSAPDSIQQWAQRSLIPKRTELLDGIIVEKAQQSPRQVYLRATLAEQLQAFEEQGWLVRQRRPISHQNSEPEPDVSVVRGRLKDFLHAHPATAELVAEVLDDGSRIVHLKQAIYAGAGVREYWIILPEEQRVEVHTRPLGREYMARRVYLAPEIITSEALPTFQLDLGTFFPG